MSTPTRPGQVRGSNSQERLTHSLMVPQPFQYFTQTVAPLDSQALGVPASYVLSSEDVALPPGGTAGTGSSSGSACPRS
jgi:hypothetical protein